MSLSSTDLDVIEKFRQIVGCGNVGGPYWHSKSTRPQWAWTLNRADEFLVLAEVLRPFLGERRLAKLNECLAAYNEQPQKGNHNRDKTVCPKGHPYSGQNILRDGCRRRCRECERQRSERKNIEARGYGTNMVPPTDSPHPEPGGLPAIEDVARKMRAER
jgi:hypothetical protein